ncbi:GAF domain-containing sensor histidine kinase [Pedobacter cryotolerans]|uniref:histidine kinase n=1 Tax=Pedobacter cryotolerans TaxID=2571270 RepID=A0A4U1C6L3_9SPHI|nr:GAF domain-containing sensor histidine kinase [Pedobacter cryotolerans]TKB99971.1 GAF domain-containing sensor histidine kinase [Pedobacter cryotolerans]
MSNFQIPNSLIPDNDAERIKKLRAYDILDTPEEDTFNKIAILAAQIFNTPIAQVTFVDEERVFFKTNISPLAATEINRNDSFCSIAILNNNVTLFSNILEVPELQSNPFVTMENGVRFYAGAPLKTTEGLHLGTVCVLDVEPKEVTEQQLKMLETLSAIAMDELELRLATRKAMRTQTDMMNRIVHDLKNPNTTISLSAELIKKKADDPKVVTDFADRIKRSATSVLNSLNNLLDLSQSENASFRLNADEVDVLQILEQAKNNFELIAAQKQQNVIINCNCSSVIYADSIRLQDAFENLLSNALKYAHPNTTVLINVTTIDNDLLIEFKDQGQGLLKDEMSKLFTKFARLSAVPTGKEHSNGLGLSIVKMLVELHHGKVWAESEGKDKGASFFIALPVH